MKKYLIAAMAVAGSIVVAVTNQKTDVKSEAEALSARQTHLAALAQYAPDPGFCREATIVGQCEEDADRTKCQMTYVLCSIPIPDAGWSTATLCYEADGGGTVCPDATVLIPPKDEPRKALADDAERRCRRAAKDVCDNADAGIDLGGRCIDETTEKCLALVPFVSRVVASTLGEPYQITTETKVLDRVKPDKVKKPCACRNTKDAGVCRVYTPGDDAGGKDPAPYKTTLHAGTFTGPGCVPSDCYETEAREAVPGCDFMTEPCLLPTECR